MARGRVSVALPWKTLENAQELPAAGDLAPGDLFITLPVKQLDHLLFNINGTFQPTNSREDIQVQKTS